MILNKSYKEMTDKEIVNLIISGNEEAILYLLYDRYESDLKFYTWKLYNSLVYLEELINCLYIHLKGKHGDWQPLKTFQWKCEFRTWFCSVVYNLFKKKRNELIGFACNKDSIVVNSGEKPLPEPVLESTNQRMVMLLEAINRLYNDDYRFILIKELEGYNHNEIAEMMVMKRERENKVTYYKGQIVVPDARYIDMKKSRALKEIKIIIEQIKKEWYDYK